MDDPLALDPETMRQLGYRTVDMLVEWLNDVDAPPLRRASPAEMQARLGGAPPEKPESCEDILDGLRRDVLPFMSRGDHPGFFAFIPFCGTWPGALGDFVAAAANVYAGSWMESAGPTQVELEVLGWFKQWIGYPDEAAGSLVSGGSAANMTALACARERLAGGMRDDLMLYVPDQAHSSIARAARILGFRPQQMRVLPTDAHFRLEPHTLAEAIETDQRAGRTALFVAATAGATNTGAIDPLPELADVCRERGVWLHVDAAYGGFAVLTERGREALRGIDQADSVTLDPHKWLYQPYECGCLLVRDGDALRHTFEITPDYLHDARAGHGEVNFADLGLQLTRVSRALKLWVSLRCFGIGAFRDAIQRSLELADLAWERILADDRFEPMAPPALGVRCFRRRFDGVTDEDELARMNAGVVAALEESGIGLVSSTRLRGRYAIRLCVLNHTTRAEDVERVIDFLATAQPAPRVEGVPMYERDRDVVETLAAESRGRLAELARESALGREVEVPAGEKVVERWDTTRDFYVVLDGSAEVRMNGERLRELGPGDFFGELAAREWLGGFSYPRLATVVASSPLRLLVLSDDALEQLVQEFPELDAELRAAARERLAPR
jgi:aromatic-L-amino-acid decarboxylase